MIFTIGGLAGQSLASNVCFATLPISLIVMGSMIWATPMSAVMQRFGRRVGFFVGTGGGTLGAVICAYALTQSSFALFLLGSFFTGIYMSAQGFYRFAAADTASAEFRPKAISWVMAGGSRLGGDRPADWSMPRIRGLARADPLRWAPIRR